MFAGPGLVFPLGFFPAGFFPPVSIRPMGSGRPDFRFATIRPKGPDPRRATIR